LAVSEAPQAGQIVDYSFLWDDDHRRGRVEGRKARPCLIIAGAHGAPSAAPRVALLPITSQPPGATQNAIAIPDDIKARIGLDRKRGSWLILDDVNVFTWPGFDLVPQADGSFVRGVVTRGFFAHVRETAVRVGPRQIERDD
jgi:hypothetical protein